ncbi:MAG: hypothetical protein F4Y28_04450 [Acidimicrobiia bacterium]|nr:hypothetical protein [Acidimicrobiia bacterium]MYG57540.1 hypothetical protein [Acidimicrobiia bacterium]MYJ34300.1 hypothetical protein [Acidimicrobiia bacterium]
MQRRRDQGERDEIPTDVVGLTAGNIAGLGGGRHRLHHRGRRRGRAGRRRVPHRRAGPARGRAGRGSPR